MNLNPDLIGVVVGGAIGGAIFITVFILVCYLVCKPTSKKSHHKHRHFYDPGTYLPSPEPSLVYDSLSRVTKPHRISSDPYGGSLPTGMNRWGSSPGMYAVGPNPAYHQFHKGFPGFDHLERGKAHSDQRLNTLGVPHHPVRRANSSMVPPSPGRAFYQARSPFVPLETSFETQLQETFLTDNTIRDNSAMFNISRRYSVDTSSLGTPGSKARLLKKPTETGNHTINFGYESDEQEEHASPNNLSVVRPVSGASRGTDVGQHVNETVEAFKFLDGYYKDEETTPIVGK